MHAVYGVSGFGELDRGRERSVSPVTVARLEKGRFEGEVSHKVSNFLSAINAIKTQYESLGVMAQTVNKTKWNTRLEKLVAELINTPAPDKSKIVKVLIGLSRTDSKLFPKSVSLEYLATGTLTASDAVSTFWESRFLSQLGEVGKAVLIKLCRSYDVHTTVKSVFVSPSTESVPQSTKVAGGSGCFIEENPFGVVPSAPAYLSPRIGELAASVSVPAKTDVYPGLPVYLEGGRSVPEDLNRGKVASDLPGSTLPVQPQVATSAPTDEFKRPGFVRHGDGISLTETAAGIRARAAEATRDSGHFMKKQERQFVEQQDVVTAMTASEDGRTLIKLQHAAQAGLHHFMLVSERRSFEAAEKRREEAEAIDFEAQKQRAGVFSSSRPRVESDDSDGKASNA